MNASTRQHALPGPTLGLRLGLGVRLRRGLRLWPGLGFGRSRARWGGHRADSERGSATIWAVCALTLVSAAVSWCLLWTAAESTRHSAERAADSAALTAARAALRRLSAEAGPAPCAAAAIAARKAGASLVSCACLPLDCSVSVARNMPLLGSFADGLPNSSRVYAVQARSRAGPVGESGTDGAGARRDGLAGIGGDVS